MTLSRKLVFLSLLSCTSNSYSHNQTLNTFCVDCTFTFKNYASLLVMNIWVTATENQTLVMRVKYLNIHSHVLLSLLTAFRAEVTDQLPLCNSVREYSVFQIMPVQKNSRLQTNFCFLDVSFHRTQDPQQALFPRTIPETSPENSELCCKTCSLGTPSPPFTTSPGKIALASHFRTY